MSRERKAEHKPLSFSTTMRNPNRIVEFLKCLLPFENKILNHDVIMGVIKNILKSKIYQTMYSKRMPALKDIFEDENKAYTNDQLNEIIINSPQDHKEAGFDKGWDSRFDTFYKLPMEFGFVKYAINEPIKISNTGHMLVDAFNEQPINDKKIQNVMLNSLIKYQTNNPYRKNANQNAPLILLMQVLALLKKNNIAPDCLSRQELSILICWTDNDAESCFNKILNIRNLYGTMPSDEIIYDICLNILGATTQQKNRFKMNQICGEAVDEYIRKMRSTGIISLRGNGRFFDLNKLEQLKIDYILQNYSSYKAFSSKEDYYSYMGEIDNKIIEIIETITNDEINDIRLETLKRFAQEYTKDFVYSELRAVCNKKESKNELLRIISAPCRLEFLTSIALVQHYSNIEVFPNYSIDDEGLPIFTASGGMADIVCYNDDYNALIEVTLMYGRQEQVMNEIIPIRRHLLEAKAKSAVFVFALLLAPRIHVDTYESAAWYKQKDKIDIIPKDIETFINDIANNNDLISMCG